MSNKFIPVQQSNLSNMFTRINVDIDKIYTTLNEDELLKVYDQTQNRYLTNPIRKWIGEKLAIAYYFNLDKSKNKRILDIGTGAGWFPYICKTLGHNVLGTDELGRKEYDPVYDFFNIEVIDSLVHPFRPIENITGKFNLITCMRGFFSTRPQVWNKKEWHFFFEDILKYMEDDGHLYLSMNSGAKRFPYKEYPEENRGHYGSKETSDWLEQYEIPKNHRIRSFMKPAIMLNTLQVKEILNG